MSMLKKYQTSSKENVSKILESSMAKLEALDASFTDTFKFPSPSAASAGLASPSIAESATNEPVAKAVSQALDAIASVSQDAQALEMFLHLHIPKMEDGNNFGVTVQLALLKMLTELQEAISGKVDDLMGYSNARADALEKLKLPSSCTTVTKSMSVTTTDGKKEEKASEATEEKKTSNESGPSYECRVAALLAVDTHYYLKARRSYESVMTLYLAALDFMDKNKEKLEKPKGSGGSHSGFSSMY